MTQAGLSHKGGSHLTEPSAPRLSLCWAGIGLQ